MSVAPYFLATSTVFSREPTAKTRPAPWSTAPRRAIKPTGPIPITATASPKVTPAILEAWRPVGIMSESMQASSGSISFGKRVRFPSASLTWKRVAKTPSLILENFQPPSIPSESVA